MDVNELRNLKEFLLLYNKISEDCFKKCVYDMTTRSLPPGESDCIATCVVKHINVNHKTMALFADINPPFQQRKATEREEEFRKMQEETKKAEELAALPKPWYISMWGKVTGNNSTSTPPVVATTTIQQQQQVSGTSS